MVSPDTFIVPMEAAVDGGCDWPRRSSRVGGGIVAAGLHGLCTPFRTSRGSSHCSSSSVGRVRRTHSHGLLPFPGLRDCSESGTCSVQEPLLCQAADNSCLLPTGSFAICQRTQANARNSMMPAQCCKKLHDVAPDSSTNTAVEVDTPLGCRLGWHLAGTARWQNRMSPSLLGLGLLGRFCFQALGGLRCPSRQNPRNLRHCDVAACRHSHSLILGS